MTNELNVNTKMTKRSCGVDTRGGQKVLSLT